MQFACMTKQLGRTSLVAEEILSRAKTHFGSKVFTDQGVKCLYNFALMVPPAWLGGKPPKVEG